MEKRRRSFQELIWLTCLLWAVKCLPQEDNDWGKQFEDMKRMLNGLHSKMVALEFKMNNVNVLDYAFKVNTIDNQLSVLNTNMESIRDGVKDHTMKLNTLEQDVKILGTQLGQKISIPMSFSKEGLSEALFLKVESIHDAIKNLPVPDCPKSTDNHRSLALLEKEDNPSEELMTKLDDYGRKLIQSNQGIQDDVTQHRQDFKGLLDVVKTGFSKVISKVDITLQMEGQISNVIRVLQEISTKTTSIAEQMVNFLGEFLQVKGDVTTSHKLLKNISKSLNNSSDKCKSEIFPIADLTRAVEIGKDLEIHMNKFSAVEGELEKARALSRILINANIGSKVTDIQSALNLSNSLVEIEELMFPLYSALPYNLQNLQAHVGDALTFVSNKTQCHSNQMIQLEIQRLRDIVDQKSVLVPTEGATRKRYKSFDDCRYSIREEINKEGTNLTREEIAKFARYISNVLIGEPVRIFPRSDPNPQNVIEGCYISILKEYADNNLVLDFDAHIKFLSDMRVFYR